MQHQMILSQLQASDLLDVYAIPDIKKLDFFRMPGSSFIDEPVTVSQDGGVISEETGTVHQEQWIITSKISNSIPSCSGVTQVGLTTKRPLISTQKTSIDETSAFCQKARKMDNSVQACSALAQPGIKTGCANVSPTTIMHKEPGIGEVLSNTALMQAALSPEHDIPNEVSRRTDDPLPSCSASMQLGVTSSTTNSNCSQEPGPITAPSDKALMLAMYSLEHDTMNNITQRVDNPISPCSSSMQIGSTTNNVSNTISNCSQEPSTIMGLGDKALMLAMYSSEPAIDKGSSAQSPEIKITQHGVQSDKKGSFTQEQKEYLEAKFRIQTYYNHTEMQQFADELNVDCQKVKVWFQNQRKTKRRDNLNRNKHKQLVFERVIFTTEQKEYLESKFKQQKYYSHEEMEQFSADIHADCCKIKGWFRARRTHFYKEK